MRGILLVLFCTMLSTAADAQHNASKSPSYGTRQIDQMLADRPDMKNVFPDDHPIAKWVATKFEKGDRGQRVMWDYSHPTTGSPAEHLPRAGAYSAAIRISNLHETTGLDKWGMLVFEFYNMENGLDRINLENSLLKNEIKIDEFANECIKTEYDAMLRTSGFLEENNIRSLVKEADHFMNFMLETPQDFDEGMKRFKLDKFNNYDPRQYFAEEGKRLLLYRDKTKSPVPCTL